MLSPAWCADANSTPALGWISRSSRRQAAEVRLSKAWPGMRYSDSCGSWHPPCGRAKVDGAYWRRYSSYSFYPCRQPIAAVHNCIGSAPEAALARPTRALTRRTFTKNDPALAQVIGCNFHVNAVTHHRTDPKPAHFAGCIGDNPMLIVQGNAEASIGQDLVDRTFHRNQLFFRQIISRSCKNLSHTGESRCEAKL